MALIPFKIFQKAIHQIKNKKLSLQQLPNRTIKLKDKNKTFQNLKISFFYLRSKF